MNSGAAGVEGRLMCRFGHAKQRCSLHIPVAVSVRQLCTDLGFGRETCAENYFQVMWWVDGHIKPRDWMRAPWGECPECWSLASPHHDCFS